MGIFQPLLLQEVTRICTLLWKPSTTVLLEITEEEVSRFYQTLNLLISKLSNLCHPEPIPMLCSRDLIQCHLWCTDYHGCVLFKKTLLTKINSKNWCAIIREMPYFLFHNNILYFVVIVLKQIFFVVILTRDKNCTITSVIHDFIIQLSSDDEMRLTRSATMAKLFCYMYMYQLKRRDDDSRISMQFHAHWFAMGIIL